MSEGDLPEGRPSDGGADELVRLESHSVERSVRHEVERYLIRVTLRRSRSLAATFGKHQYHRARPPSHPM